MRPETLEAARSKASTLVEALPYIRRYRGSRVVVKIGGEALDDETHGAMVAEDLALMTLVGIEVTVVHGGGPQITRALRTAGLEARFVEGLRVTDSEAMGVVSQVLAGSINPTLVARLNRAGIGALGLSGIDSGLLRAVARTTPSGVALGRVGRIEFVDASVLTRLLDDGFTPVIASIAPGPDGEPMNVNADEVAGAVAAALNASKLVYLTNVEGLYRDLGDEGTLVSEIGAADLSGLLGDLTDGMKPKMTSALEALKDGVGKVHILDGRVPHALLLEVFTDEGIGTQVVA